MSDSEQIQPSAGRTSYHQIKCRVIFLYSMNRKIKSFFIPTIRRVLAENEYGLGVPCETKQAVKISECPSSPENVEIGHVTDTSATVVWIKPEHDGGSPVSGYVVEMSQIGGFEAWKVAGSTKNNRLVVNKLPTGKDYIFRVRAQVLRLISNYLVKIYHEMPRPIVEMNSFI